MNVPAASWEKAQIFPGGRYQVGLKLFLPLVTYSLLPVIYLPFDPQSKIPNIYETKRKKINQKRQEKIEANSEEHLPEIESSE